MAELRVSTSADAIFVVPGLGSCVGLVVYDLVARVAGLAHVMLPESAAAGLIQGPEAPAKFADLAIPRLIAELKFVGAAPERLMAKAAGGAQMFRSQGIGRPVGVRNAEAVRAALELAGIPVVAADLGGSWGRTVRFLLETWTLEVRAPGRPDLDL